MARPNPQPRQRRSLTRGRPRAAAGLGVAVAVGVGAVGARTLLVRQAAIARRRIGKPLGEDAMDADRVWRPKLAGEPVVLAIIGDSIAAGLGAERPKQTLGARLAKGLAARIGRPVRVHTVAVVGSESSDLAAQLDRLGIDADDSSEISPPDVAVIIVGGNDVTHRIPSKTSAAHLAGAVGRLRAAGVAVIVGTCPDLGALRPVPQPLRSLAGRQSRVLAAAQADAARRAGASVVSLRRVVGRMFSDEPDRMFAIDRFHPSALGYRRTAEALLPMLVTVFD